MTIALVSTFLTYTFITALTPGPNNILALSSVHNYGFRRSLRVLTGMITGFLIIMLLCALFTYTLLHFLPSVTEWLTYVGTAYILWLAVKVARSNPTASSSSDVPISFWNSFMLQFANVKIILYGITALSTFVLPYTQNPVWIIGVSLLLSAIGTFGIICWAAIGHLFQNVFRRYGRTVNLILAALLVWVAVDMLW